MRLLELFLVGVGLSMDAFAVSVCKGLAARRPSPRQYLAVGLWFGGFQALMPTAGYYLGAAFERYITDYDHWVAFVLLALIGANMLREGLTPEKPKDGDPTEGENTGGGETKGAFSPIVMLPLAVATSIDALAVGISFGVLGGVSILGAAAMIGVTTCLLSMLGLRIGSLFGLRYKRRAEIAGGAILILIGVKILLEGLSIIPF